MKNNSFKKYVSFRSNHDSYIMISVLIFLSLCSIFAGFFLSELFSNFDNFFWNNSSIINFNWNLYSGIEYELLPLWLKNLPLILSLFGIFIVFFFYFSEYIYMFFSFKNNMIQYFFEQGLFFNFIYNKYIVSNFMYIADLIYKIVDKGFLSLIGPTFLRDFVNNLSKLVIKIQTGFINNYLYFSILSINLIILIILINL